MPRSATAIPAEPLGSLAHRGARGDVRCRICGSERVTRIAMELTDGTPVDFTSCLQCENRSWEHDGEQLSVEHVLARTRRTR